MLNSHLLVTKFNYLLFIVVPMYAVFRNKYFLTSLVILFLLLLFVSPYIAYVRVYRHVTSTVWDMRLLYTAAVALVITILPAIDARFKLKRIKFVGGLLTLTIFIWVYKDYGFINGAFFMSAYYLLRLLIIKIILHNV